METKRPRGRPPLENGPSVQIELRIGAELLARLDAWRGAVPRSEVVRLAIERLLRTRRPATGDDAGIGPRTRRR